jgi:chlorophyll(ide) b reductase
MNVVITGSTKGIGLAMARVFLQYGDCVVVSSRNPGRVQVATDQLRDEFPEGKLFGLACDVTKNAEVEALATFAQQRLGTVDIWINNAGTNGYHRTPLVEASPALLETVISTNLLGTLLGCRAALRVMVPQGHGHIWNMAGRGSEGAATPRSIAYGASKQAIPQLNKTLIKETEGTGVGVHMLSPGMVLTDLLLTDATPEVKRVFNILAEQPETVAQYLVPRIRRAEGTDQKVNYLTMPKVAWRFATAWTRKNRFFDEAGEPVAGP